MKYAARIPKSEYQKEITSIFYSNTSRGYADWRQCGGLEMDVCGFLDDACKTLSEEGRYDDLFDITNKAYAKWSDTDKDDSNGETQGFCSAVQDNWNIIYEKGEACISHDKMMKWFMSELEDHAVIDYMEDDLYDFLLKHFYAPEELQAKLDLLERVMKAADTSAYSIPVLENYYVRVLADRKAPIEEIRAFVKKSGGYSIGETLAQIEVEYGNYDAAIDLYQKRIAERPDRYWSNEARKVLIEIYKKIGDRNKEFEEVTNYLWNNVNSEEAFLQYKSYFTKDEWPARWEKILADSRSEHAYVWCAEEGRYDLIMDMAEAEYGSHLVVEYEKRLVALYPERCLMVLIKEAKGAVTRANKRSDYRYLARDLKRISKYPGGKEAAVKLAGEFAFEYPRRKAMLDELRSFL
jgi:tetratricopeptide (TPR) repeat protein